MIGPLRNLVLTEDGRTKPAAAVVVVVVLVLSCSALGYYVWQGGGVDLGGGEPQISAPFKCYSCGYTMYAKVKLGVPMDICPKCKKSTLCPAKICPKCGSIEILNENRGLKPPTKCSKCGAEIRHGG